MNKITSFTIDHNILEPGLYISKIDKDITTYDLRFKKPNTIFLDIDGIHTIEHLFATYVRNSIYKDSIIYVGPMGCRTGFYFIVRNNLIDDNNVIELLRNTFLFISNYEGEIPGNKKEECGNYLEHDLVKAKSYSLEYYNILKNIGLNDLKYKNKE